jgi:hypothetical protein
VHDRRCPSTEQRLEVSGLDDSDSPSSDRRQLSRRWADLGSKSNGAQLQWLDPTTRAAILAGFEGSVNRHD